MCKDGCLEYCYQWLWFSSSFLTNGFVNHGCGTTIFFPTWIDYVLLFFLRTTRVVANRITRVPIAAQYLTRDLKSVLVTLLGRRNLLTLPVLRVLAHSSLDSINLQGSEVFDSSLDCLRVCHNLKFLTMPGAHVSSSCILEFFFFFFFTNIPLWWSLWYLHLTGLIESFLDLPHLVKLDVASCHGVNDDVLQAIALNCPLIQLLILGKCCNFTDAGLKFLALHLRQLTVLDISHTKVKMMNLFTILSSHVYCITHHSSRWQTTVLRHYRRVSVLQAWPSCTLMVVLHSLRNAGFTCSSWQMYQPSAFITAHHCWRVNGSWGI